MYFIDRFEGAFRPVQDTNLTGWTPISLYLLNGSIREDRVGLRLQESAVRSRRSCDVLINRVNLLSSPG